MEEYTDYVGPKYSSDVRSMLRHGRNEVWFWGKKHHLIKSTDKKSKERAAVLNQQDSFQRSKCSLLHIIQDAKLGVDQNVEVCHQRIDEFIFLLSLRLRSSLGRCLDTLLLLARRC